MSSSCYSKCITAAISICLKFPLLYYTFYEILWCGRSSFYSGKINNLVVILSSVSVLASASSSLLHSSRRNKCRQKNINIVYNEEILCSKMTIIYKTVTRDILFQTCIIIGLNFLCPIIGHLTSRIPSYAYFSLYYSMLQSIILEVEFVILIHTIKQLFCSLKFSLHLLRTKHKCQVSRNWNSRSRESKLCSSLENKGIYKLQTTHNTYNKLCDLIDDINKAYGLPLLVHVVEIIEVLLISLYSEYFVLMRGFEENLSEFVYGILLCSSYVFRIVAVTKGCSMVSFEVSKYS